MSMKLINSIPNCQVLFRKNNLPLEDLTGRQHTFIFSICESPGRTQDSIAQELHLDKSTVARALAKLEQNGYVERKSNPKDTRELLIYPTNKAIEVFPKVKQVAKEWAKLINQKITEEETNKLLNLEEHLHKKVIGQSEAVNSVAKAIRRNRVG